MQNRPKLLVIPAALLEFILQDGTSIAKFDKISCENKIFLVIRQQCTKSINNNPLPGWDLDRAKHFKTINK
ncbi:MAG TPA: hypothetical protein VKY57_15275, partial [Chitinispirillaceae bacterium]|nr:hypothetical protein [Chitinispirillaceae bacterium]